MPRPPHSLLAELRGLLLIARRQLLLVVVFNVVPSLLKQSLRELPLCPPKQQLVFVAVPLRSGTPCDRRRELVYGSHDDGVGCD